MQRSVHKFSCIWKVGRPLSFEENKRKFCSKQRQAGASMIVVFFGRVDSLANTESTDDMDEDGLHQFIDSEVRFDGREDHEIYNDTGPMDGYDSEAEFSVMANAEVENDDYTEATESAYFLGFCNLRFQ